MKITTFHMSVNEEIILAEHENETCLIKIIWKEDDGWFLTWDYKKRED